MKQRAMYLIFGLMFSMLLILAGCQGAPAVPSSTIPASPVSSSIPPAVTFSPTLPPVTASPGVLPTSTETTIPSASPSVANGQRIYDSAASDSGQPITYTGGPGMMMPVNLTCAECHGTDGHGGTIHFMMQSYDAPNITWPVLSGPDPDMKHPPYTEDTLKRAIIQGIDPGGSPLEYPMPRWQMSAQDLNDLVAFIKTLK